MGNKFFAKTEPFTGGSAEQSTGGPGPLTLQLKADLVAALKTKDDFAKSAIRMALAALQNAEVAGDSVKTLSEDEELAVLTKEVRKREDSAATYASAGRPELASAESAEAEFLKRYLPAGLSDDELAALVDAEVAKITAELGAAPTMKQMGALVKAVNAQAKGRADGAKVAQLVKAQLS